MAIALAVHLSPLEHFHVHAEHKCMVIQWMYLMNIKFLKILFNTMIYNEIIYIVIHIYYETAKTFLYLVLLSWYCLRQAFCLHPLLELSPLVDMNLATDWLICLCRTYGNGKNIVKWIYCEKRTILLIALCWHFALYACLSNLIMRPSLQQVI